MAVIKFVMTTLTPTAADVNLTIQGQTVKRRLITVMEILVRMVELVMDGINSFTCGCASGFIGTICETEVDECESSPCQNDGTCTDEVNRFTCVCASGFTGTKCAENIDECGSSPCEHDGTCMDHINEFNCSCASGFTGIICETDIDECESSPCDNGASCLDDVNSFSCELYYRLHWNYM